MSEDLRQQYDDLRAKAESLIEAIENDDTAAYALALVGLINELKRAEVSDAHL